jgi:3D-(3,5/4)-trihydroxycyclohexane-1,2-dione acylhydrolase (decyclizing)
VFTSIGPGALHALAASIVPASDGIGVWYLFGDETTEDEGPNMQQIPKHEQGLFAQLCATMGRSYSLHTPLALPTALRRGLNTVDHPHRPGPYYLLMPMNTQPARLERFNLAELTGGRLPGYGAAPDGDYERAADLLMKADQVLVKLGGGSKGAGPELLELIELADAVVVTTPIVTGVIPYAHPRNMTVGGSKGSLCGNYAMEHADLLVAVGTRGVCQSDCSRTGYPAVENVINLNTDPEAATHYGKTIALVGDAALTLLSLNAVLKSHGPKVSSPPSAWLAACTEQRQAWEAHKARRYAAPCLFDNGWGEEVLTQPGAIKTATDWARAHGAAAIFDAGDVQANGFQIAEDERLGQTFTETGASYMGFAVSALLAAGLANRPFYGLAITGDGSFTMNPQILIDGVEHAAHGCILLLDNRRMAAISGLQMAQYGADFATSDSVVVDYLGWARSVKGVQALDGGRTPQALRTALDSAIAYPGLSLIHVPVYYGPDELGGMGAFGRWNVGNWCEETQALRHEIGL